MTSSDIATIKLTCFRKDVYEPSDDSFLLVDVIQELYSSVWKQSPPRLCLEIGCGSGYVLCSLALILRQLSPSTQLLATDINPSAALATHTTLSAHNLPNAADVVLCDLASSLTPRIHGCIDLLVFNPPYVPTPDEEVHRGGIAAAWAGGDRGRLVIDKFLSCVPKLLSPQGDFLLVVVHENDPEEIIAQMGELGLIGEVAGKRTADEEQLQVLRFRHKKI